MEVSYKFFKEYPMTRLLITKIMDGAYPSVGISYRIKKLVDSLSSEFEIYKQMLKEKEDIIEWDEGKKNITNQDVVKTAFDELYSHNFNLDFKPLDKVELESLKDVSPREIELLEMISEPSAFDSFLQVSP